MNVRPQFNKHRRRVKALSSALKDPNLLRRGIRNFIAFAYNEAIFAKRKVETKDLEGLVDLRKEIRLSNYHSRDGNVSQFELLAIATIVANQMPRILLEIGTFDGNTTLQLALNAPKDAIVHTLDLPSIEENEISEPMIISDLKYVCDKEKLNRKYLNSVCANKVVQHLGDSTVYDFNRFCKEGSIEFAFINGGHSYECVRRDTENTLKVLAPGGIILWHDFVPDYQGVFDYLNSLCDRYPIKHIKGTTLGYYKAPL